MLMNNGIYKAPFKKCLKRRICIRNIWRYTFDYIFSYEDEILVDFKY